MIDELAIRGAARQFMVGLDLSGIANDLTVYTTRVNAKLKSEEMGKDESGYTLTKRNGSSSIVVNDLERRERQRFTTCHEVGHLVLGLVSSHQATPAWSYAKRDDNEIACDVFATELLMPFVTLTEKNRLSRWWSDCVPSTSCPLPHVALAWRLLRTTPAPLC